ncbi:MAG: rhomboid family intramembrane serine protease [Planctomycetes bacterium]|nr:rhomboid family intramembrane serine protease [Planctomycetota bacterium]
MSFDGPRLSFPPLTPAVRSLLLVNCAVFVANAVLFGRLSDVGGAWFACTWSGLSDGFGLGALRLVTYQFTHSFRDPMHLAMNLLVLYFFGTMVEPRLGARGTLRLYLAGGLAGALLHLATAAAHGQSDVPLVGASGACYALLVFAACLAPRAMVFLVFVPVPLWALAAFLVGLGAYSTFVEFATGHAGQVAHGAHLGGAALGALAHHRGWFAPSWRDEPATGWLARWRGRWRLSQQQRHQAAAAAREHRLDAILAKVKREGIGALTAEERRFLDRQSQQARDGAGR